MTDARRTTHIIIRKKIAVPHLQMPAIVKRQKGTYSRHHGDKRARALLPYLDLARAEDMRTLDDLLKFILPLLHAEFPHQKLSRATLRRRIIRLHELGLAPGLDDRSTARKLGRPTKGPGRLVASATSGPPVPGP